MAMLKVSVNREKYVKWCDDCGGRVVVGPSASHIHRNPRCPQCGCTRHVEEPPERISYRFSQPATPATDKAA